MDISTPFVLLINPWIHDFSAYDLWMKPIGLLSIAGRLKNSGFGIHMIDCLDTNHSGMQEIAPGNHPSRNASGKGHFFKEEIPKPDILKHISKKYRRYGVFPSVFIDELNSIPEPKAVLITSIMTYWYPGVFEAVKTVRSIFPQVPILLGGIYATLCTEHARSNSGADEVFAGPCNRVLLKKIEALTGKTIAYRLHDLFPCPDYELMSSKKSIPILTSTGCPFNCPYCASALLNPVFRQRNPIKLVDVIEKIIADEGTTDIVFYDDALLVNAKHHIIPLLHEVLRRKLAVRFHVPNGLHIRNIDHTLAELMMRTGFQTLRLGLESSDPEFQVSTGNKVSNQEFVRAAGVLKGVGFGRREVGVYVMAGLPGQSFQSIYDTVKFVQDQGARPYIAEYSPIPGTSLWDSAVACSPFPVAEEPLFHNNTLLPCRSDKFTFEDLSFLKIESRKLG